MGVIEDTVAKKTLQDLQSTVVSSQGSEPELTEDLVNQAITLLRDIPSNGGYGGIRFKVGISMSQVKEVHKEMLAKIAELTPEE